MVNVLKFPDRSDNIDRQEFLQDDDILRFDAQETAQSQNGGYKFASSLSFAMATTNDWTNQELANLCRVKRLLDAANVPSITDRGITDEGDPWFLFCDAAGEVFIHFCRIDNVYMLDSPNIQTPLRGRDFNELVETFISRKIPGQSEASDVTSHKVVRLERNGKVFLHPSTMLAALIWTLFLASEDLVMVVPNDADHGTDELPNNLLSAFDEAVQDGRHDMADPDSAFHTSQDSSASENDGKDAAPTYHNARPAIVEHDGKLGQNSYAISLSVIAISMGLVSTVQVTDVDAISLESILELLANQNDTEKHADTLLTKFALDHNEQPGFLVALANIFDDVTVPAEASKEPVLGDVGEHIEATLLQDFAGILQSLSTQATSLANNDIKDFVVEPEIAPSGLTLDDSGPELADTGTVPATVFMAEQKIIQDQANQPTPVTMSKFSQFDTHRFDLQEYTVNETTVTATFNIDASELTKTNELMTTQPSPSDSSNSASIETGKNDIPAYDDAAYQLISHLVAQKKDLEIIATSRELIFINPDVFDANVNDTHVMSWSLESGDTISVIGMQSDYADFGIVA